MDPILVSNIPIVTSFLAAVFGALLGSVVGPILTARLARVGSSAAFVREQRREAYTQFAERVEQAQRKADATSSGEGSASFTISDLDEVEFARVKIDLFGTHLAKVWAYRCTLALISLEHAISEQPGKVAMVELPRAKLHEARTNLVRVLRVELGVPSQEKNDRVSRLELIDTKAELRSSKSRVNSDGHHAWLDQLPQDADAIAVSHEATAVYRRAATAALGDPRGHEVGDERS